MNTRSRVQAVSGLILDYFIDGKAPSWKEMISAFIRDKITKLNGTEKLSEEFLFQLFKNSEDITKQIEFFNHHHHFLIFLMLKEEYCMESCYECGYVYRKIGINTEEEYGQPRNTWM